MDVPTTEFGVADAKARFSELLARAEAGESITISRHGRPVAKLATYLELANRRRLPLATLDSSLVRAANAIGVELILGNVK